MVSSSSSMVSQLGPKVTEKLARDNFLLCKAQFLPAICGAQLMGYLEGTIPEPAKTLEVVKADDKKEIVPNPKYDAWVAKDQQVLNYLLNSLTKDVLAHVTNVTTTAETWEVLATRFAAHSKARVANLRMQLTNTKKGSMTSMAYFNKMMAIRDELAAVGKKSKMVR